MLDNNDLGPRYDGPRSYGHGYDGPRYGGLPNERPYYRRWKDVKTVCTAQQAKQTNLIAFGNQTQ